MLHALATTGRSPTTAAPRVARTRLHGLRWRTHLTAGAPAAYHTTTACRCLQHRHARFTHLSPPRTQTPLPHVFYRPRASAASLRRTGACATRGTVSCYRLPRHSGFIPRIISLGFIIFVAFYYALTCCTWTSPHAAACACLYLRANRHSDLTMASSIRRSVR